MNKRLSLKVYIKKRGLLTALRNEFYKVAGKAGAKFGKAEELDESGEYVRRYWLTVTQEIHDIIDQIDQAYQRKDFSLLTLTFSMNDPDFQEFLKDEFAQVAARMSKDAWREYSPALRQTILEEGPFIATQMRDQVCEFSQPSLFKVEQVTFSAKTQQAAEALGEVAEKSELIETIELT